MITMSHTCRCLLIIYLISCVGAFVNENEIIENVNKTVSVSNLKDLTDSVDESEANFNVRGVFFRSLYK